MFILLLLEMFPSFYASYIIYDFLTLFFSIIRLCHCLPEDGEHLLKSVVELIYSFRKFVMYILDVHLFVYV